jgi:hypothetical protein
VVHEQIAKLRTDKETKWAQYAKVKHIQEGGKNPKKKKSPNCQW